ncbi:hypothetical protein GF312_22330 [Candidatus Poribacteria bacterium]|nr:hypothetical protein [Candidatus Poribacteria bacterium]
MIISLILVLCLLTTLAVTPTIPAAPISVPLDTWYYHFIERLQAKGALRDFLSNIKPYTRDEIADMLIHISKLEENDRVKLSSIEKAQFIEMKKEFAPELIERGMLDVREYARLLNWDKDKKSLVMEAGITQTARYEEGEEVYKIYEVTPHIITWGSLDKNYFYNTIRITYEDSDKPLPLWDPYLDPTRENWTLLSDAYLILNFPGTYMQFGKDQLLWGTGYDGVIGLSGVDPTFDVIKIPVKVWKLKFTSILGFLRDDLTREYLNEIVDKYITAHRVEIRPFSGLCLGWQEAYIYTNSFHLEILNPIMPYTIAEDYLGDAGNINMEADFDLCVIPNTRLYGSVFVDDFHPDESIFTYSANRWAVLGGIFVADPLSIDNLDLRAEYARVEPWTYAHKGTVLYPRKPTSYKHFDNSLGHWIGPNADDLLFEANYRLTKYILTTASYQKIRDGEIGGNIYDYDITAMGKKKTFPHGIVETEENYEAKIEFQIHRDSILKISYKHTEIDNKQTEEAKLPESDPRKEPWQTGKTWSQDVIQVELTLRY